jgi:hypothetical protein
MTPKTIAVAALLSGTLLLTARLVGAADPALVCKAAKLKAAGKLASCRLTAQATATKSGQLPLFTKCDAKFATKWTAAERSDACPTSGDASRVFGSIVADVSDLVLALDGPRFIDQANGTVLDTQTGLVWEKKVGAFDAASNLSDPHDPDNLYAWSASGFPPDGSVFMSFLAGLNACVADQFGNVTGGFAGRCDWRLPTAAELQGIRDCSFQFCLDPVFGTNGFGLYWTAASVFDAPFSAWVVGFNPPAGSTQAASKGGFAFARAVRGSNEPVLDPGD